MPANCAIVNRQSTIVNRQSSIDNRQSFIDNREIAYSMTLALITGATGFVGANLVEAVTQAGWQARALRRSSSSLKALEGLTYEPALGDVTDYDSLVDAMRGVDFVFHVAAVADYWRADVERLYHVNVEGTRHVLRAAQTTGVRRVVFTSSVASLGWPAFGHTVDERAVFNIKPEQFRYGHSKVLAEQVVAEYARAGLDVVTVNPAVVIGPRDVNLISGSIIAEAKRIGIPMYPRGGVCVIDVADVCAGHIATAERGRTGERYILGGENLWYRDMLTITNEVVGRPKPWLALPAGVTRAMAALADFARDRLHLKLPINGDQLRASTQTLWFDSAKARRELGLTTRSYRESAQRTYDWYRANGYL
jgi:dihydroflavonol-4-reductase